MWNKLTIFSINNSTWISSWIKQFCNSSDLAKCGFYKRSGASVSGLLRMFLALPLTGLNLYEFKNSELPVPGRDAFYRMLKHPGYHWRRLLYIISQKMIGYFNTLTDQQHQRVLIIDDTSFKRNRSKSVEYLGRQHDHSDNRYYRGFRMLTLAWSDGHSCLPCEFELLTNHCPDKRIGPDPQLDGRSVMGRRVKVATQKATDVAVTMVNRALSYISQAGFVVFDSWFALPGVIEKVAKKIPVICRVKDIPAIRFRHGNRIYSLKSFYTYFKSTGMADQKEDIIGWMNVQLLSVGTVRVVFIKNPDNPDAPMVLISTDTRLDAQQICRIYAQRWDIEVCFKALKQHLGLYHLQVRNYTALVGCTSLAFIRCMMISYYHRTQIDGRTLPGVFYQCIMQLQVAAIQTCIQLLQIKLITQILQDPNRPIIALVADISDTINKFVSMLSGNLTIGGEPVTNCDS